MPRVYVALAPAMVREMVLADRLDLPGADVAFWPGPGAPDAAALAGAARDAEVLVTGWGTPPLADLLADWTPETSPLRLVAHTAGSVKRLVPLAALERGLLVSNAVAAIADAVAEFTLGAMIASGRRMVPAARRLARGEERPPAHAMRELRGGTVGVVGASGVGRKVMALLAPWSVRLLLHDPYCPPEVAARYAAEPVALDLLLEASDIVTLHAPVTPETRGMLDGARLARMRDGSLLVNTARGALVDHDALLAELERGRLHAFLDVTDPEPLPPDSPFFALETCVVTPHIAGHSLQARGRQSAAATDEIGRYLRGEPLQFRVAPEAWATLA